jgi:hypothetical protein
MANGISNEDINITIESPESPVSYRSAAMQIVPLESRFLAMREVPVVLNLKDAVYRPLMRLFRRYFRKDALRPDAYAGIHREPYE